MQVAEDTEDAQFADFVEGIMAMQVQLQELKLHVSWLSCRRSSLLCTRLHSAIAASDYDGGSLLHH